MNYCNQYIKLFSLGKICLKKYRNHHSFSLSLTEQNKKKVNIKHASAFTIREIRFAVNSFCSHLFLTG